MNNSRNKFGIKDSINTYLNIDGELYEQWSDFKTKKECEKEYPAYKFIQRQKRIYKLKD